MTLDELIARLNELRKTRAGDTKIYSEGCDCVDEAVDVIYENDYLLIARAT